MFKDYQNMSETDKLMWIAIFFQIIRNNADIKEKLQKVPIYWKKLRKVNFQNLQQIKQKSQLVRCLKVFLLLLKKNTVY